MGVVASNSSYNPQLYETLKEDRQQPTIKMGDTNNPLLGKNYYHIQGSNLMVDDYGKSRIESLRGKKNISRGFNKAIIKKSADEAGSGVYTVENYNKNIIPQLQSLAIKQAPPAPARIEGAQEATADDIINPIKKEDNTKTGVRSKAGGAKSLRIPIGSTPVSAGVGKV